MGIPLRECMTLRDVRLKHMRISQAELAAKHRVAQSTLSKLERGEQYDELLLPLYMKVYGIASEKRFIRLWRNRARPAEMREMEETLFDNAQMPRTAPIVGTIDAAEKKARQA